jgi:predicted dehydrogenase
VNLCARIPAEVDDESAAFTVLSAIGLQGIRLAAPTLGETVVVIGLGLIGLATVQLLRANGCRVIGIDFNERRVQLAQRMGAEAIVATAESDTIGAVLGRTSGRGADAVIITASTNSAEPVSQAARMSRKRGRIVLVGVAGLELNRAEFYEKELIFQVSCSYGPGRYDPAYEQRGRDYPAAFVRWTEQRNFEAVLQLLAERKLTVSDLITHRFDFAQATEAYSALADAPDALGIILRYGAEASVDPLPRRVQLPCSNVGAHRAPDAQRRTVVVGFIGAGNYASRMLIPAFRESGALLDTVVTASGASAVHHGKKAGFAVAATEASAVLEEARINTVVIATRHDTHARYVVDALDAGKNVFVEKPLALTEVEIESIDAACSRARDTGGAPLLMVGFNRRFSPLVVNMKKLLDRVREPKAFVYTCNAGSIPPDHWTQDPSVGGGRIIGEACHFVDLLRFLVGARILKASIVSLGQRVAMPTSFDSATIALEFADGSIGTVHYFANGGKAFAKERIEVFAGDAVLQLDNFVSLRGFGWPNFNRSKLWRQDKGQDACASAFVEAVREKTPAPIPSEELFEVARVMVQLANMQRSSG